MSIFFTSDTHFYHKKILDFCRSTRLGADVDEMNEILIQNWNQDVRPNDDVYHLGDFSFGRSKQTLELLSRLNGKIHLVKGNHDGGLNAECLARFASIQHYASIRVGQHQVILMHFPIEEWDRRHYGSIHLHGHTHGNTSNRPGRDVVNRMDVGIDTHICTRVYTWEEIVLRL